MKNKFLIVGNVSDFIYLETYSKLSLPWNKWKNYELRTHLWKYSYSLAANNPFSLYTSFCSVSLSSSFFPLWGRTSWIW